MRSPFAWPAADPACCAGRQSDSGAYAPSARASGAPRDGHRSGLGEILGVFIATLVLIGAPALPMIEELRDPACARPAAGSPATGAHAAAATSSPSRAAAATSSPFRALTVEDHRIARCLGDFPGPAGDERLALAPGAGRALPDPTW